MEPADGVRPAKTTPEGRCPKTRASSLVEPGVAQDESVDLKVGRLCCLPPRKLAGATITATNNSVP
jgi:hypothetical protein